MQSTTGLEERDTWRNKILRALDELRDHERTVGASLPTAPKGTEDDAGCTHE